MFFDLSVGALLVISLFFITAINCALTYLCCTKSLEIMEVDKSVSRALNKLRVLDQYLLSKINIIVALIYFGVSYLFIEAKFPETDYVFFFSCILSFPLTLITTFASRVCYCYTCNVLMETKLNEFECLVVNFKRLVTVYLPFVLISFVVPTVYSFELGEKISNILCISIMVFIMIVWVSLSPKIMRLSLNAKEIVNNSLLKHRLVKLMEKHNIKRYKLYTWDSSRSKESNAMVSGVRTYHLFISTTLIEDVTLPELETVITHEIGHIKNKHLIKMMISKIFVVSSLVAMALLPQILKLESLERTGFYALTILAVVLGLIISVKIERKYEDQADMYAACYNDPELFASALRKVIKYEEDTNKIDELFQSHPDIKDRIEKVKKGEF